MPEKPTKGPLVESRRYREFKRMLNSNRTRVAGLLVAGASVFALMPPKSDKQAEPEITQTAARTNQAHADDIPVFSERKAPILDAGKVEEGLEFEPQNPELEAAYQQLGLLLTDPHGESGNYRQRHRFAVQIGSSNYERLKELFEDRLLTLAEVEHFLGLLGKVNPDVDSLKNEEDVDWSVRKQIEDDLHQLQDPLLYRQQLKDDLLAGNLSQSDFDYLYPKATSSDYEEVSMNYNLQYGFDKEIKRGLEAFLYFSGPDGKLAELTITDSHKSRFTEIQAMPQDTYEEKEAKRDALKTLLKEIRGH